MKRMIDETLQLTEYKDGYWLWDETRGMNLAMNAKTAEDAFVQALKYYQERLSEVESQYYDLVTKVDAFIEQIMPPGNEK